MAEADGRPQPPPDEDVIARLVHDLRSPLTVVEGFAHLLERDDDRLDTEQRMQYAQRIKAAAAEIRELLDTRRG